MACTNCSSLACALALVNGGGHVGLSIRSTACLCDLLNASITFDVLLLVFPVFSYLLLPLPKCALPRIPSDVGTRPIAYLDPVPTRHPSHPLTQPLSSATTATFLPNRPPTRLHPPSRTHQKLLSTSAADVFFLRVWLSGGTRWVRRFTWFRPT